MRSIVFTGARILNSWENKNYSDKKNGGGKNNRGKTPPLIQVKHYLLFEWVPIRDNVCFHNYRLLMMNSIDSFVDNTHIVRLLCKINLNN